MEWLPALGICCHSKGIYYLPALCQQSTACGLCTDFFPPNRTGFHSPSHDSPSLCRMPIQGPWRAFPACLCLPCSSSASGKAILQEGGWCLCRLGVAVALPSSRGNSYSGSILWSLLDPDSGASVVTECLDPGLAQLSHLSESPIHQLKTTENCLFS